MWGHKAEFNQREGVERSPCVRWPDLRSHLNKLFKKRLLALLAAPWAASKLGKDCYQAPSVPCLPVRTEHLPSWKRSLGLSLKQENELFSDHFLIMPRSFVDVGHISWFLWARSTGILTKSPSRAESCARPDFHLWVVICYRRLRCMLLLNTVQMKRE